MVRVCVQCSTAYDTERDSMMCDHKPLPIKLRPSSLHTTDPRLRELFHIVWTKAVGQERYNKKEWQELRERLDRAGIYV
jgi:hypothetical protein